MTQLDRIVYIVRYESCIIKTYTAHTLRERHEVIDVEGMTHPTDIVACDGQLYVADEDYCIWRVSTKDKSHVKWLTTGSATEKFPVSKLSLTPQRLLVTSDKPRCLREYSTMNGELMRHVTLPQYVRRLYHAVETTHNSFVISHRGTLERHGQDAVSELLRFCHTIKCCV